MKTSRPPHIILGANPLSAKQIWDDFDNKPIVWVENIHSEEWTPLADGYNHTLKRVHRFPLFRLLYEHLRPIHFQDCKMRFEDIDEHIAETISEVRACLPPDLRPLSSEKLRLTVVGSHTSLMNKMKSAVSHNGTETAKLIMKDMQDILGSRRRLAAELYDIFNSLGQFEVVWLRDVSDLFKAEEESNNPPHVQHMQRARELLAENVTQTQSGRPIRGAIPIIFEKLENSQSWEQIPWQRPERDATFTRAPNTTSKLLKEYRRSKLYDRSPIRDAILVMAIVNPSEHNPMDPPAIGRSQIKLAAESGISKILIDDEYSIVYDSPEDDNTLKKSPPIQIIRVKAPRL